MAQVITEESVWCAFPPGKQAWKSQGNYFTAQEIREMAELDDLVIYCPADNILSAD